MSNSRHKNGTRTFENLNFIERTRSIQAMTLDLEVAIKRCLKDELAGVAGKMPASGARRTKAELLTLRIKPLHAMIERIIKEV